MNLASITAIASIIEKLVKLGPAVIQTIEDAKPFAEVIIKAVSGKELTPEEITKLEATIDALSAEFQQPLPEGT